MTSPSVALCVTARDDAEELKRLLECMRGHVDKIVVAVQPDSDEVQALARQLADEVIEGEHKYHVELDYEKMFERAGTNYVIIMDMDETLEHPERLREIAAKDYDIIMFPRRNWISGYQSKYPDQYDASLKMLKPDKAKWSKASPPDLQLEPDTRQYVACECWIDRHRTIEKIRELVAHYQQMAEEDRPKEAQFMDSKHLSAIEAEHVRRTACGRKIKILLSYSSLPGFGDILMTTPAVREVRRRYPEAEITYKTDKPDALGKGKRSGENLYECLHPAIDFLDVGKKPLDGNSDNFTCLDDNYDLIVHWEFSSNVLYRQYTNGYELESWWSGFEPSDGNFRPDWTFAKGEEKFGRNWIRQHCKTKRCIGLVLSSNSACRTWPRVQQWVNAMLESNPDISIMAFGWMNDFQLNMTFLRRLYKNYSTLDEFRGYYDELRWDELDRLIDCSGIETGALDNLPPWRQAMGLNLREMASVFPYLDLLITPDTGPMHIAAALKVPTVAYFGTAQPELRIKHFPEITALVPDYPCFPCYYDSHCKDVGVEGAACLRTITVEMLTEEVNKRLAEGYEPKPWH